MNKHVCHWPGCTVEVPPARWGCAKHWFTVPYRLRADLSKHYRRGQELPAPDPAIRPLAKTPSIQYVQAARAIQDWIFERSQGKVS